MRKCHVRALSVREGERARQTDRGVSVTRWERVTFTVQARGVKIMNKPRQTSLNVFTTFTPVHDKQCERNSVNTWSFYKTTQKAIAYLQQKRCIFNMSSCRRQHSRHSLLCPRHWSVPSRSFKKTIMYNTTITRTLWANRSKQFSRKQTCSRGVGNLADLTIWHCRLWRHPKAGAISGLKTDDPRNKRRDAAFSLPSLLHLQHEGQTTKSPKRRPTYKDKQAVLTLDRMTEINGRGGNSCRKLNFPLSPNLSSFSCLVFLEHRLFQNVDKNAGVFFFFISLSLCLARSPFARIRLLVQCQRQWSRRRRRVVVVRRCVVDGDGGVASALAATLSSAVRWCTMVFGLCRWGRW